MVNVDVERHVVPFERDVTKYSFASTAQVKTTLINERVTIDSAKMSVSGEREKHKRTRETLKRDTGRNPESHSTSP